MLRWVVSVAALGWRALFVGCVVLASCQCPKLRLVGAGSKSMGQQLRRGRVRVLLLTAAGAKVFDEKTFDELWPVGQPQPENPHNFKVNPLESEGDQDRKILERRDIGVSLGREENLWQFVEFPPGWCDNEQGVKLGFLHNPPIDAEGVQLAGRKLLVDKHDVSNRTEILVSDQGLLFRPRSVAARDEGAKR